MLDGLQEILFTLRRNKLRTVLTAFGVFWGIFMLIMLLGFGRGMQNGVMDDFGSEPLDVIILWAGDTSVAYHGMGLGRKIRLEDADIDAIRQQVKGVRTMAGMRSQWGATVSYNGKNSNAQMHGIPDEYFRVEGSPAIHVGPPDESGSTSTRRARSWRSAPSSSNDCSTRAWIRSARTSPRQGRRDDRHRRVPRQDEPGPRIGSTCSFRSPPTTRFRWRRHSRQHLAPPRARRRRLRAREEHRRAS